jgi:RNA polymerase sigma-70 factor, ECF subfamily
MNRTQPASLYTGGKPAGATRAEIQPRVFSGEQSVSLSFEAQDLLNGALAGRGESLGRLLQLYTNYLKLVATPQLDARLQSRMSASDIVQDTLLEAHHDFPSFRGRTCGEFVAWLRQILVHNLARQVQRHVLAGKRDVRREVSLDALRAAVDRSAMKLEAVAVNDSASPSVNAMRHEHNLMLADCMASLPSDYRQVILLRNVEGLPFPEVAERMERTAGAVRMLWLRAIDALRIRLEAEGAI